MGKRRINIEQERERERAREGLNVGTCSREQNDDDTIFSSQGTLGARPATKSPFSISGTLFFPLMQKSSYTL